MKKSIMVLYLSLVLTVGIVGTAHAVPANVGFVFDGLDLDTGTVEYDRTVLVILMGETIEELLRPDREYLADFSPSVDVSFEFDPGVPDMFDLILQDSVKIAVLENTSFEAFDYTMLGGLAFSDEPYSVSVTSDDLVLAWTAEDRYIALSGFHRSGDWTIDFDTTEVVPEPSTLLLLGLGLAGVIAFVRRKKNIMAMLAIVLLASLWSVEVVNAQPSSLITVKKEGAGTGTILVGDQECDSDCVEMSVPYVDRRSVLLKVFPDPDSYFVRWKKADGSSSKGAIRVQPGDTVIAVFGKKWVPFDPKNPAESPTPPELRVPVSTLQEVVVDVDFPGMHVGLIEKEGTAYQHLTIPGSGYTTEVGKPKLPMLGRYIALPAGANVNVEILESSFQELEEYTVYPTQEPLPDIEGASIPPFTIDSEAYQQDAFYPSNLVELEGPFIIRGSSVVILRMFPVQFNPVQRTLRVHSNLRVKVSFEGGGNYFIEKRVRNSSFDRIFNNLLLNANTALSSGSAPNIASDIDNSLLIITHPNFLNAANTLAEWKIKKGIHTVVWVTNQSGSTASAIQQFIRNAYNNWNPPPTYVLLIGDADFIPCHYETDHPYNTDTDCNNCQGDVGTDLYYATLDGADYFPDISIGRLSVDTLAEANKRVNDIIIYEKNPPANTSFYTSAVVAAYFEDRDDPNTLYNEMDGFANLNFARTTENIRDYLITSGYTVDRIYFTENAVNPTNWSTTDWPGTGAPIPISLLKPTFPWDGDAADIDNAINNGRFLVIHRDHGFKTGWGDPFYHRNFVTALTNGNELPVVWSINCETGWFDNESDTQTTGLTPFNAFHFSEAWERNANGGAVGILAATRVSYSPDNDRLVWGWMDAIWPNFESSYSPSITPFDNPVWEMGPVLNYGKFYFATLYTDSIYRRIAFEMYHWFGDPTMQIWTDVPQTLNVSHPLTLPAGSASIDVTVNQSDALICISKAGQILGKSLSTGGITTIPLSVPLSAGDEIHIVVTKHNFRPYEGTGIANLPTSIILYDAGGAYPAYNEPTDVDNLCLNSPNKPSGYSRILAFSPFERDMSTGYYGISPNAPITGPTGIKIADNWTDLMDGDIDTSLQAAGALPPSTSWWSSLCMLPCWGFSCYPVEIEHLAITGNSWDTTSNWLSGGEGYCDESHQFLCLAYNPNPSSTPGSCQVTNENDSGPGSLLQVLAGAWINGCTTITFAPGVSMITLSSQLVVPPGALTIDGGTSGVTISGNKNTRVFWVDNGADVTFQNLIITDGQATDGGGIYNNRGTVIVGNGTEIIRNTANQYGGGIYNDRGTITITSGSRVGGTGSDQNRADFGGGIYHACGELTVNGTIRGNTADVEGGGIFIRNGIVTIASGSIVSGNTANNTGGGIYSNGYYQNISIANGTVHGNTASSCNNYCAFECINFYDTIPICW